ncbi:hypothetical protein GA0070624_3917 [Micromonospora rhizosphaerae]|uniref:Uncharacterized protein n=2 Tax=Micromonospora rhizosphaerae TaxID=568872 RepID=A0A1C6SJE4_9ACTN|nr:hypothetical protein GA0070624_3917 [Micromonospora rhizosphaerae]
MPRLPHAFRIFWLGKAVSLLGTATTATLLSMLAATELDAGPGWMGVLAAASWSPWLILAQAVSAAVGVLLDAISFLVSAVCLARARLAPRPPDDAVAMPEESLVQRIRAGVGVVARDPFGPLKGRHDLPAPPPRPSRPLERSIPA